MKIPKSIKIAGVNHKVINKKELGLNRGYEIDGKCNIDKQEILLNFSKEAGNEYKELVFIHEITHLLFYYSGIGKSKLWDNEQDVHNFSVLLHQFLKDNNLLKNDLPKLRKKSKKSIQNRK